MLGRLFKPLMIVAGALLLPHVVGCPGDPDNPTNKGGPRSEKATQWMKRAGEELSALDLEEAKDSIDKAASMAPGDPDISLLAARIHLARLDFKSAAKALENIEGSEAAAMRARAYWYADDLPHASENIVKALEDPAFKDPWAKPIRELAGTQGTGRKPFTLKDSSARLVEMRMPRDLGSILMIPCEIDGQSSIAIIDTGVPEVILDSKGRSSPGWVSFKFTSYDGARSMEFRDVPAFVQDLSPFTKGQTIPVGAVLGMNFIRHMHVTFDRLADQLVLRREDPAVPPIFTKVPIGYYNGGGMLVRATISKQFDLSGGLWINSGTEMPLLFPEAVYKKIGIDTKTLSTTNGKSIARLQNMTVGGLAMGPADSVAGETSIDEQLGKFKGIDVIGQAGMGFMAAFRVTVGDNGRALWLETDTNTPLVLAPPTAGTTPLPKAPPPPPKASASASASGSAKATPPPPPKASASTKPPAAPPAPPKASASASAKK